MLHIFLKLSERLWTLWSDEVIQMSLFCYCITIIYCMLEFEWKLVLLLPTQDIWLTVDFWLKTLYQNSVMLYQHSKPSQYVIISQPYSKSASYTLSAFVKEYTISVSIRIVERWSICSKGCCWYLGGIYLCHVSVQIAGCKWGMIYIFSKWYAQKDLYNPLKTIKSSDSSCLPPC